MRRIRIRLFLLVAATILSACGAPQERAESFVESLISSTPRNQLEKEYKTLSQSEELKMALVQRIESLSREGHFDDCCYLISRLEGLGYQNEAVKDQFSMALEAEKNSVFYTGDSSILADYISLIRTYNSSYYFTILDCFPYDGMTEAIREQCVPVIVEVGRGGYYDSHEGEVEEESYWWSPLFEERTKKGEVGYQQITKRNLFAGDFDVTIKSEIFYGTQPSDYGNSLSADLYYKGQPIMGNYQQINDFLALCTAGNTFYCEDSEHHYTFFVIGKDRITVLQDKMFDIVYK